MNVISIILICAVPMFILCYNLITFAGEIPDYGTNHLPTYDYQGYKIDYKKL
jgi:hypothetical protein